jgi:general secretion pathway protein J
MKRYRASTRATGFTLIELLTALLILSALALMCYRGLGAVLDARDKVERETDKWRRVAGFFGRFERDVLLAAPRAVRTSSGSAAAWLGRPAGTPEPVVEFSRFASNGGTDTPRRLGYRLNDNRQIELWLWPGLDVATDASAARYPVLEDVSAFEVQYLNADLVWSYVWPESRLSQPLPRAVRVRVLLGSGEELVRVFALIT